MPDDAIISDAHYPIEDLDDIPAPIHGEKRPNSAHVVMCKFSERGIIKGEFPLEKLYRRK